MNIFNENIIKNIREELGLRIDQKYRKGCASFFKEQIICYGVRTPIVRQIAKKYFKNKVKFLNKKDLFNLCQELFKSDYHEEAIIAIHFLSLSLDKFQKNDFKILYIFLNKYINNWAKDDDFCTHVLGVMIGVYPDLMKELKIWSKSKNMWVRRASAVSFISSDRRGNELKVGYIIKNNLNNIFEIARILMFDKEDLVQKGYGWMLKVASSFYQKEVFDFVMKYKKEMSRTALRYAIEKMPGNSKRRAMEI